ncbi:MAG: glutathione S-transferase [Rhodospirillales bacterium]|nr:glutathione S-transferase [Rhodospirillales bacterium]
MRLWYTPTSPYGRKVMVTAIEAGLDKKIEIRSDYTKDPERNLWRDNPLGKIPALALDNGKTLIDSPVICEYLDSINRKKKLFPAKGWRRWTALHQQAIADGVMDAALLRRTESLRPESLRSQDVDTLHKGKVARALDLLEKDAKELSGGLTIGQVAVACALGYLDLRFAADEWRKGRPKLAAWYGKIAKRPSFARTKP